MFLIRLSVLMKSWVKVMACGICGSDVHGLDGSTGRRIPPLIMGHEASGIIAGIGSDVRNWKNGDRVTFDSTVYRLDDWYSRKGMYNISDNREVLGVSPVVTDAMALLRNMLPYPCMCFTGYLRM